MRLSEGIALVGRCVSLGSGAYVARIRPNAAIEDGGQLTYQASLSLQEPRLNAAAAR